MGQSQSQFAFRQPPDKPLEVLGQLVVRRMRDELVQIARNRADILGDAPLVVIQDRNESLGGLRDIIQGLEGNSIGQRRIAENGHDIFIAAALVARRADAQRC